jgi:hypothetical protein
LEAACVRFPLAVAPRVLLGHWLLQENKDLVGAEKALRAVLELDLANAEARHNLALLLAARQHDGGQALADAALRAVRYRHACATPSDIHEHLPTLHALAKECRRVTEFGTRAGVSTTALLHAQPPVLVCYDLRRHPAAEWLLALAGRTELRYVQQDVLGAGIEETDLLFIDTIGVYDQLRQELARHAAKVRRYIVQHDTTTFGTHGEVEGQRGLWPAVEEFLARGTFRLKQRYENNNSLTVLEAVAPSMCGELITARWASSA